MTEGSDREFLRGIFLVEAWDATGALEDGLSRLDAAGAGQARAAAPLLVLAHRLKGSAALHGFAGLSEVAAAAEAQLDGADAAGPEERAARRQVLAEIVALLKESLDVISATGAEDAGRIAAFRARHPALFETPGAEPAAPAPPAGRAVPDVEAAPAPAGERAAAGEVDALHRFFAEAGEVLEYFGQEAGEHVDDMAHALLAVDRGGWTDEALGAIFRAAHTLKGAAYTVGCGPVGDLAHRLEDVLVAVRERRLPQGPAALETALVGLDALRLMLQAPVTPRAELAAVQARFDASLAALLATAEAVGEPAAAPSLEAAVAGAPARAPAAAGAARAGEMPRPAEPAPAGLAAVPGASIRVKLDRLDSMMDLVGELMIARSRLERRLARLDHVSELLAFSRARLGRAVRDFEGRHRSSVPVPRDGEPGGGGLGAGDASVAELFAELEFDRYDDFDILARGVGEISADLGEARSQHAGLLRAIREDMAHIQRLTAALRKEVTRSRMVPIGRLFARFARQVREAARAAGKVVRLETHGESAEVDNAVIEQLSASLLHVVQNAISHGIEPEGERRARGKAAHGTVSLRAWHQGGFILVRVEDDGRGLDPDRLREQAVRQGLVRVEEARALSTPEALNLIFLPGFTTAPSVTRAAGRGIGLDVVRTNVNRLNGEIEVDTEPGVRTRFTFTLPLTVAIADALLVRAGSEVLAIPLTTVGIMRFVDPAGIHAMGEREMVELDGQPMELIRLGRVLGLGEPAEEGGRVAVVVLRAGGLPFAVAVDELLGKQEIVIKPLGDFLDGAGPFAGATISGEGRVILLIDPTQLFELSRGAAGRRADEPVAAPAAPSEGPRAVLLVDDSVSVRRFVGQMLERAGFRVTTAVDGQDALEQLAEQAVDCVITDLEMPRVNGYALIEDLRRRTGTRHLPVVVLTTRTGDKHAGLARRLGVRHYVGKPVEEHAFVRLIESVAAGEAELCGTGSA